MPTVSKRFQEVEKKSFGKVHTDWTFDYIVAYITIVSLRWQHTSMYHCDITVIIILVSI